MPVRHRDVGVGQHVFKVRHQRFAGQQGEAFLDLEVGAGGVDDQNVEEEQAQEAEERPVPDSTTRGVPQGWLFRIHVRGVCAIFTFLLSLPFGLA